MAGCSDCAGPTSGLDDEVRARLDEFRRTGCIVCDGIIQGNKLGESPYGIVYEVSLSTNVSLCKAWSLFAFALSNP